MRVKNSDKKKVKKKILEFLEKTDAHHNLSEIARKINKAPPTILKYVNELQKEGRVSILDKKSMKLIKIKKK